MSVPPSPASQLGLLSGLRAAGGGAIPTLVSSAGAVALALLAGGVVILVSGQDPLLAYQAMFIGAFGGPREISETLIAAAPLILGGLAFAIAYQAGLFNIGIEGQLVLGGLAAGLVAATPLGLPIFVHLPLAVLAAVVAGGFWGGLPGFLKARTGAHEVITTIMLNYIAFRISAYVIANQGIFPMVNPSLQATNPAVPEAELPRLIEGTRLHAGLILALVAAAILWYVLFRTTFGYRLRMVGISRGAAAFAGVSWGKTITVAMVLSGVLGGLAGAGETLGLQGRYFNISSGYGFTAIAVGLVGRNHPAGVVLAGLLFGALNAGATRMQSTAGTPRDLVSVLLGLVILSVAAFSAIDYFRRRRQQAARARGSTRDRAAADAGEPEVPPAVTPPAI
ncbi:MAG: ABC transporter permease [Chloroflexota bacterium]|nr:ABC transporter permease [Chloroflexota bacterium]